jgi:hypothetical protein
MKKLQRHGERQSSINIFAEIVKLENIAEYMEP